MCGAVGIRGFVLGDLSSMRQYDDAGEDLFLGLGVCS